MQKGKSILTGDHFQLTLRRLTQQLIENYGKFENTCIIGIQPRGVFFADRIVELIREDIPNAKFDYGKLDITFYRDDFRRRETPIAASQTNIQFIVEDKKVILIDDVLYTGRTIQAALSALLDFGRPSQVELMTLVDRRFHRHLPIQSDYNGITVDALNNAYVKVEWKEAAKKDRILMFSGQ